MQITKSNQLCGGGAKKEDHRAYFCGYRLTPTPVMVSGSVELFLGFGTVLVTL